jgi:hypothetical protein
LSPGSEPTAQWAVDQIELLLNKDGSVESLYGNLDAAIPYYRAKYPVTDPQWGEDPLYDFVKLVWGSCLRVLDGKESEEALHDELRRWLPDLRAMT